MDYVCMAGPNYCDEMQTANHHAIMSSKRAPSNEEKDVA